MSSLQIIVGGQFGSEAKGHIAGYLARPGEFGDGLAIRVGGGNAGHTVYGRCPGNSAPTNNMYCPLCDRWGHPWRLRHVPVAAVTNPDAQLALAAGSEIDPEVLDSEIQALDAAGYRAAERLHIDPMATVVEPHHAKTESIMGLSARIGSTGKGIGAARADRIMRIARVAREYPDWPKDIGGLADVAQMAQFWLRAGRSVQIEGTQGYGLGLHTEHYPQVTSGNCRAVDFLAQAGVNPWGHAGNLGIWVVVRPHPIRVAGNSGPLAGETSWADLGLPTEHTTVTHKVRRVGTWDPRLVHDAVRANGGPDPRVKLALTMADQIDPKVTGVTEPAQLTIPVHDFLTTVAQDCQTRVQLLTTSPATVVDLR